MSALAARILSISASIAPVSLVCLRPSRSTISPAGSPLSSIFSNTVLAIEPLIDKAAREYPYAGEYTMWPGPNSNTFTAWVGRAVPELGLDLPPTAIGKDYLGSRLFATAPSGSGIQLSLLGLLGFTASGVEGLELNVLGLTFGVDPFSPAIKLPLIGRIGAAR